MQIKDLVNSIVIQSPGLDPDVPHEVKRQFTDKEMLAIKNFISHLTLGEMSGPTECQALRKLWLAIVDWENTSP